MNSPGKSFYAHRFDAVKLPFKLAMTVLLMASWSIVRAQTLQTLYSFTTQSDRSALTLGNDGNFYGTLSDGGSAGYGAVFQVTPNGAFTTLVSFGSMYGNGEYPESALTLGNDGNIYGTTMDGGTGFLSEGTIFKMTTGGALTTLVSFYGTNGANPGGALTLGSDGNFYGTTENGGGTCDNGTLFKVTTNGTLTTLVSCNGNNGENMNRLTLGNDGNFYGTTQRGGSAGMGSFFQVTTNGTLTTLASFSGDNGWYPSQLTLGNDGNFYGTTEAGGSGSDGTVFQVTTTGALTTLFSFSGNIGLPDPSAGLTLGKDGNFYGTTSHGGSAGVGTVFQVTTTGALTILASFSGNTGEYPSTALTLGKDGNLYGTTIQGGSSGDGTVFRLLLTPAITAQPQCLTNDACATVTFSVSATSLYPLCYQWLRNGTNLSNGGNISGATNGTLTITSISDSDAATYSVVLSNAIGSVLSSSATLTVIDPISLISQPTNLLVLAGANATFGVSATGSAPLFQWQFNSANLLYSTNAICTIASVGTNNAGNYSVVVSNPAGSVMSSNAALTVVLSPTSQTNYASSTALFTATAISPESLSFQWQKNGVNLRNGGNISGATDSTLTITTVSDADAATYAAVVSDAYSGVTTSNSTLTVSDSLFMAAQPSSQTVGAGSMVTFTATAYGAPPLIFQWSFNRTPIGSPTAGTDFSSLTLTNVGTNEAGNYTVQVFNGSGSLTSSNAVLTVIPQPTLALQILAGYPLLTLNGILANNFVVQYSSDMASTNWIHLLSMTNVSTSSYQFVDPSGVAQPARFYRAFFNQ